MDKGGHDLQHSHRITVHRCRVSARLDKDKGFDHRRDYVGVDHRLILLNSTTHTNGFMALSVTIVESIRFSFSMTRNAKRLAIVNGKHEFWVGAFRKNMMRMKSATMLSADATCVFISLKYRSTPNTPLQGTLDLVMFRALKPGPVIDCNPLHSCALLDSAFHGKGCSGLGDGLFFPCRWSVFPPSPNVIIATPLCEDWVWSPGN
jgi:hypothetical protein